MLDEAAEVALVAQGDRAAFTRLVGLFAPKIEAYAARIVGNASVAQDMTQEVMVRLWLRAAEFDSRQARLTTWLHQIAHNLCIDYLRANARFVADNDGTHPKAVVSESQEIASPEALCSEEDRVAVVVKALAVLSESQRSALVLTYYQQLSNREVAEIMGLSARAVESLLVRSRSALKKYMSDAAEGLGNGN